MISPTKFKIGDTSGVEFLPYKHGGIARQIKVPKIATFVSHYVLDYDLGVWLVMVHIMTVRVV